MNKFLICFGILVLTSCASSSVPHQPFSYADPMQYMSINVDLSKEVSYVDWEGAKDIVTSSITECATDQVYAYCMISDHLPLFVLPTLTKDGILPSDWDFEDTKFELIGTWETDHGTCSYQITSASKEDTHSRHAFLYDSVSGLRNIFFLSLNNVDIAGDSIYTTHDALFSKGTGPGLGAKVFAPNCTT